MKQHLTYIFFVVCLIPGMAHATPYYTETGFDDTVSRINLNPGVAGGTNEVLVNMVGNTDPRGLAIDTINNRIYYANGSAIWSSDIDGNDQKLVTATIGGPGDIEIDAATGKLYFSTGSGTPADRRIQSVNTDGTGLVTIHDASTLAITNPVDTTITTSDVANIELDLDSGRLYWTADNGAVAGRIALNSSALGGGAAIQHFVASSRGVAINKMDIDFEESFIYYTVGSDTNEVRRSTLSGTDITTLVSSVGRPAAIALDLDNDDIFFSVGGIMYQSELDGTGLTSKSINGNIGFNIADIEIGPVPEPSSLTFLALGGLAVLRRRRG